MIHRMYEFLKRAAGLPDGTNPTNELTAKILPLGNMNSLNPPYPTVGYLKAWGKTKPTDGSTGYAPGCEFHHIDGADDVVVYYNVGTVTSCSFKTIPEIAGLMGLTIAATKTLAVTTADKLTIAGDIVPAVEPVPFKIFPHATQTTHTILNNRSVAWTVVGITVTPDKLEGGALTATIVKATANAAPSAGTTPMHAANAIDCNANANTSQVITLTATTADLALAATDKIGIVFSAALTTGILSGTIWMKRS